MNFEEARADDVPALIKLIASGNLPPFFIEEHLGGFLLSRRDGAILAAGGVEIYEASAVLRSIVVSSDARGTGLGRQLAERLVDRARSAGCTDLYLFTQDAHAFWEHLGFVDVPLDAWREAPRRCWQYQYLARGQMDAPMGETTRALVEAFVAEAPDPAELGTIYSMWKHA